MLYLTFCDVAANKGGGVGGVFFLFYIITMRKGHAHSMKFRGLFGVKIQFYMFDILCASEGDFATPAFTTLPFAWLEGIFVSVWSHV